MTDFWVVRDGERIGPFAEEEILRGYESGALHGSDLLWAEGIADGATVEETFTQLREAILTSSQGLALANIRPPDDPAASLFAPASVRAARHVEGPIERAVRLRRRRRPIALGALLAVVVALAAVYYFVFA
ncbi:MAG TPA: DUF4339 domain-containing protein [Burkholderiales bacterium]|jgi:hypothetical protein|nr:DUF4339 domain-containing protein [Burkholderiales bacterium]